MLLMGDADGGGGTAFVCFLYDGPMSLAICRASPSRQVNVAQLWSSLSKRRCVAFIWWYGVCLSRAGGHQAVTAPATPFTPIKVSQREAWLAPSTTADPPEEVPKALIRIAIFLDGNNARNLSAALASAKSGP